jgi:hypothetical protein
MAEIVSDALRGTEGEEAASIRCTHERGSGALCDLDPIEVTPSTHCHCGGNLAHTHAQPVPEAADGRDRL